MSDQISVYGYDTRMLHCNHGSIPNETVIRPESDIPRLKKDSVECPLLNLPPELRHEILGHILPRTIETALGPVWLRGHTAILTVNRLLHCEGIRIMYGNSTFVVNVTWNAITIAYKWISSTGLVPNRTLAFPGQLASYSLARIRNLVVRVHHDDDYTGMAKHNFGGPGLVEGMKIQVERLCKTLRDLYQIRDLLIHFKNNNQDTGVDQVILNPFLALKNTRTVRTTGAVTTSFTQTLEAHLNGAYERNSFFRLPLELRERVYDLLLPRTETIIIADWTQRKYIQRRWRHGHLAIMRTSSAIYIEASTFWYATRNFQLTCNNDHFTFTPFWLPRGALLPGLPFPQSIGSHNVFMINHFTIYMPVWWGPIDEEGKHTCRCMLEGLKKLLRSARKVASLTLVCLCRNLADAWYEEAMQDILRIRDLGNVEIYALGQDLVERLRSQLKTHAEEAQ